VSSDGKGEPSVLEPYFARMREALMRSGGSDAQVDGPDDRTIVAKPASLSEENVREDGRTTTGLVPALALEPDILGLFRADLRRAGVAGEEKLAQLAYLALTSRVLPWGKPTERPVSIFAKGSTSTGKSHATKTMLRFVPETAYLDLASMSKRYLFYTEESLAHRFIYVSEWASIREDAELVAALRVLLSEGHLVRGTVDADGRHAPRLIDKEGPTGLLVTTTEAAVDVEMETRCLSVMTDDSSAQTRRVYGVLADLEDEAESPVDFGAWHELQRWIESKGETTAVLPFVRALASLMPAGATRLRRDFVTLLCLVRAHAILHQAQRETDARGRIVATIDRDYAPVRALVSDLIAEGVEASVPQALRETVTAVRSLQDEGAANVSRRALAERLGVGRSATYDRVRRALLTGYLVNEAGRQERGMKLVVGAALPGEKDFLPLPDDVVRAVSGAPHERDSGSTVPPERGLSGHPADPAIPQELSLAPPMQVIVCDAADHTEAWLARDQRWRCVVCEPPALPSEVVIASDPSLVPLNDGNWLARDGNRPRLEVDRPAFPGGDQPPAREAVVTERRSTTGRWWVCPCGRDHPSSGARTIVSLTQPACPFCGRKFCDEYKRGARASAWRPATTTTPTAGRSKQ
jgi:hypothetical protein